MIHALKTDPAVFQDALDGKKPWEMRPDDRRYEIGDTLRLEETRHSAEEMKAGAPLQFTGRKLTVRVIYILRGPVYGLQEGWCVMSTEPHKEDDHDHK